jgi:flagella basal body P-ring formation protein FlgA
MIEVPGAASYRPHSLRYGGSLLETFEGLVPVRPLAQGEILRPSDLAVQRLPRSALAPGMVAKPAQAVGLAAKRALRAGQPIRLIDLTKPELVARNETVTIVYEVPGIVLTVRGKALDAGAEGDTISVLNVQSKRTVQATVAAPGRVVAAAMSPRIVAHATPPHGQVSVNEERIRAK